MLLRSCNCRLQQLLLCFEAVDAGTVGVIADKSFTKIKHFSLWLVLIKWYYDTKQI